MPSHKAAPPVRKNGTSAPSFAAILFSFSFSAFISQSFTRALIAAAASEEPPPRPAP
ncbi:MAG: hypothetical protein FWC88_01285 [Endomicrobia bacterium]|nr:hypothetical protein [Endomicrobiia bacterium]